jgi:hypothetical protein
MTLDIEGGVNGINLIDSVIGGIVVIDNRLDLLLIELEFTYLTYFGQLPLFWIPAREDFEITEED